MNKTKNVLVTGANGYIGSHLVRQLAKDGVCVWAIVRDAESDIRPIQGLTNVNIVICSLEEIEMLPSCLKCKSIDVCFHLAWCSGSKLRKTSVCEQAVLVQQSIRLMEIATKLGCKKFIGTGSILETNANFPLAKHPNMVYAITKDCLNKLLTIRAKELKISYCWCRLCGIYGGNDHTGNLVSYTISTLLQGKSPEYSSGEQPYSFIHVEDCANALIRIAEDTTGKTTLLTLSGPECMTVRQYMEQIQTLVAPDISLFFGVRPDDGIRYKKKWFDNSHLHKIIGIQYNFTFKQGILNMLENFK